MPHRSFRRPPLPVMTVPCSGRRRMADCKARYSSSRRSARTSLVNIGDSIKSISQYTSMAYMWQEGYGVWSSKNLANSLLYGGRDNCYLPLRDKLLLAVEG